MHPGYAPRQNASVLSCSDLMTSYQMYPSLTVAGGITTLAWDNRRRFIYPLTSRFHARNPAPANHDDTQQVQTVQGDADPEAIELRDRPASRSSDKYIHDIPATHSVPRVTVETGIKHPKGSAQAYTPGPGLSSVRQRPASQVPPLRSPTRYEPADIGESTPLLTLSAKSAIAMAAVFVVIVIIFVVIRATVDGLSRPFNVSLI